MSPRERATALAAGLQKVTPLNRPFAIEVAIRDAENDILALVSERLESQPDPLSPATAVRELMHT